MKLLHWVGAGVVLAVGLPSLAAEPVVMVQYRDKPPYSHTKDGKPAGFLLERTIEIFKRAGVQAEYDEIPVKRITLGVQEDRTPICSPGWYKLPEREVYARFSLPIHQDNPHMVLAGAHAVERVKSAKTLKDLFANHALKLGKVSGASYGAELDAMMAKTAHAAMDSTVTPLGMARMIRLKRADYMLIDEEDYQYLMQLGEISAEEVKPFKFADMPAGLKRYIMCSKSVPLDTLARLDQAIAKLVTVAP